MVQPRRVARGTGPVTALTMLRVAGRLTLARGGADGVTLLDVESGGLIGHLDGARPIPVQTLSVVSDEGDDRPLLAVGGVDGVVRLWDVARQEQLSEVTIGAGAVWALTTLDTADGPLVAGVCSRQIRVWQWRDERIRDLDRSGAQTWSLCPLPVGGRTLLVSGHVDGGIQLWDPHRPDAPLRVLAEAHRGSVSALTPFTMAGGPWLASGGADRAIKLWRFDDGEGEPVTVDGLAADGTVRHLATIPHADGDLLASGSAAGLDIWRPDPRHPANLRTFTGHRGEVWSVACARDGDRTVVASGDIDGEVRLADLRANVQDATTVSVLHSSASTIWSLAALPGPGGGLLAGAAVDSTVRVIDLDQSVVRHSLTGHQSTVRALAAGPDPARPTLISGGADGTIRVWDPVGGVQRAVLAHGRGEVRALAPVRLGGDDFVVSGGADGSVRLWSLDGTGRPVETLVENAGEVGALTVAPGPHGPLLACGGSAGLRVIELGPGRRVVHQVFTLTTWALTTVTLGNRALVVCARADGTVVLLDPATRQVTATLALPQTPVQVRSLAVVPQQAEQWIVGGCHDGRILIWHAESGTLLTELAGVHVGTVRAVVTTTAQGGSDLYSAGDDGQVRRWALAGPALRLLDEIRPGTRLASILLSDQPEREDRLGRGDLVATLHELLTDARTTPPVVVGVHAPWGQGKTSVLLQLRELLDETQRGPGWTEPPGPTHELTPRHPVAPPRGWLARRWHRLRERWRGGPVRTRLTRSWAWRQVQRARERPARQLPYRMRRVPPHCAAGGAAPALEPGTAASGRRITVWFSPWMYTSAEQMWAGLTREVLNSVTRRLPAAQRDRLWFDLNLRRTDPAAMRRRILEDLIPRSLLGLALTVALVAVPVVVVVALVVSASQNPSLQSLVGPVALVTASAVLVLVNLVFFAFRHIRATLPPGVLEGPSPTGVAPPTRTAGHDWRGERDPLRHSGRGYLYLVQHDVREIIALASEEAPIVIFIDDLDRCTPEVVADTIEAINLFLNNAFGACMFVLALDPATVAAHLETAHEALQRRIDSDEASYGQLRHIGWRFMEKIVELPIRLPGLTADDLGAYVDELIRPQALGPAPVAPTPAPTSPAPTSPAPTSPAPTSPVAPSTPRAGDADAAPRDGDADAAPAGAVDAAPAPGDAARRDPAPGEAAPERGDPAPRPRRPWLPRPRVPADDLLPLDPEHVDAVATPETATPDGGEPPRAGAPVSAPVVATVTVTPDVPAAAETAAQVDYVEHIMDVQRELREAALMLPRRSPRQTKSFINLWRFYMSLEYRAGRLPQHFREIAQHGRAMARFVGMVLRFPRLLDAVSHPSPATFRRLVTAAGDDEMWQEVLDGCRLSGADPAVRELRELLRDPTTSTALLADIGERYL